LNRAFLIHYYLLSLFLLLLQQPYLLNLNNFNEYYTTEAQ
jgi:hypothetical protein